MTPRLLKKLLKKKDDDLWIRFERLNETVQNRNDVTKLREELTSIHSGRKTRGLATTKSISIPILLAANLDDVGVRSRVVEIMLRVTRDVKQLERAIDATKDHVLSTYADELAEVKTKGAKDTLVAAVMVDHYKTLDKLNELVEAAEWLVEDIDKASWSMSNSVKLIALTMNRENIAQSVEI